MKAILISGKAQSGKDTVANMLKEMLEQDNKKVLIARYGDLVKYICTTFFGWNGEKDEAGRTLLQKIGTDKIRARHPEFWTDFIYFVLSIFSSEWDYVIIPDCRFPNEIKNFDYCSRIDAISVRVERLNFVSSLSKEQQNHISETALDNYEFDHYIKSENGLDNLMKEVEKFYEVLE